MCGKDCPCQQSGFRARRNARLAYAGCATEPETFTNHQFEFKAEPFELALPGEWEMEDEGDEFEGDLYSEMEDEARRRRGRSALRGRGRSPRPRIKTRRRKPARKFPKWPFRFPLAGGLGALLVGQPPIEKPPPPDMPSGGGMPPTTQPPPDSEPPYAAEPDSEPPTPPEPTAGDEPTTDEPTSGGQPATSDDPQEEVPQWSLTAPRLLKRENQPTQTTLYVEINLKNVHKKTGKPVAPMTGIYIPDGFKPQPSVDIILYLHGHDLTGCNRAIETYWRVECQCNFPLREGVSAAGKNVVLVAPTLGSKSEYGTLTQAGALDNYLDQVIATLKAHGPYANRQAPHIGNIILACHSGGGYPMRQIALANNRYGKQIRECWGFDCTYNTGDDTLWTQWAKLHPQSKLYIYYRPKSGTAARAESLKLKKLPNVFVEASSRGHNDVPIAYWKTRLLGTSFLKNKSLPVSGVAPEFEFEWEMPLEFESGHCPSCGLPSEEMEFEVSGNPQLMDIILNPPSKSGSYGKPSKFKNPTTTTDRCKGGVALTCPTLPGLEAVSQVSGIGFEYIAGWTDRNKKTHPGIIFSKSAGKWIVVEKNRLKNRVSHMLPRTGDGLATFLANMKAINLPVEAILTMGSLYCRCISNTTTLSNHSHGDAIDIGGLRFVGGREVLVANSGDASDRKLLHRVNACLRLSFATVLDYHDKKRHWDHFHCDTNIPNGGERRSGVAWPFVRESLGLPLTGGFDKKLANSLKQFAGADAVKDKATLNRTLNKLFIREATRA